MNETTERKKRSTVAFGILVVLLIAVFVCWASTQPQALEEVKELTVTVAHSDNFIQELEYMYAPDEAEARDPYILEFETTAKTLLEALEPYGLLELNEKTDELGERHAVVAAADGEYAEFYQGYVWYCYYNGELLEAPLEDLSIHDGDRFYFYTALED